MKSGSGVLPPGQVPPARTTLWQRILSRKKWILIYILYDGILTLGGWWILGGIWWHLYVRRLDFFQRNAFMVFRDEAMMWTFLVLGLTRCAAFFVRWLFPQTFPFNVDKRKPILIILTITFDLPSLFSFVSPTSKPNHHPTSTPNHHAFVIAPTTSDNSDQERDDAEVYAQFGTRDCPVQRQETIANPNPLLRRVLSESDLTRRKIQLLNTNNDDCDDDVLDKTPAERAVWFRRVYCESLRYLVARVGPFDAGLDLEEDAIRRRAEMTELQTQYDSLRQKYYSAGKFTAKHWIWLFVRTRRLLEDINPTDTTSGQALTEFQVSYLEQKIRLTCHNLQESTTSEHFEIDRYIGPLSTNQDLFRDIEPLIDIVFYGYDVCIFADGQSGSGKSWTMFKGNDAIAPSIAASVMTWKDVGAAHGWTRQIRFSAIESYDKRLTDLLVEKGEAKVDIARVKTGHYDRFAATVEELLDLFERASTNREVRKTHENRESSRGHLFCSLVLAQSNPDGPPVRSRITLIDLAGGERTPTETQKSSQTLASETKFINVSRGALRTFLQQTRESKPAAAGCEFTKYLKAVMEKNPRLIYLAHLDPRSTEYGRTLDTLKFAKQLRSEPGSKVSPDSKVSTSKGPRV